jgi:hypothetical protein
MGVEEVGRSLTAAGMLSGPGEVKEGEPVIHSVACDSRAVRSNSFTNEPTPKAGNAGSGSARPGLGRSVKRHQPRPSWMKVSGNLGRAVRSSISSISIYAPGKVFERRLSVRYQRLCCISKDGRGEFIALSGPTQSWLMSLKLATGIYKSVDL